MVKAKRPGLPRVVRHDVLVVNHAPLGLPSLVREVGVLLVTNARAAKVDHLVNLDATLDQRHGRELGHRGPETMPRSLYLSVSVLTLKTSDLCDDLTAHRVGSLLEPRVDLTVALGPYLVIGLEGIKVCDPVCDRDRASEHDVDRVVGRQIANVPLNILRGVVDRESRDEACRSSNVDVVHILLMPAVGIDRQLSRDLGLIQGEA